MAKRFIDTDLWQKEWFQELSLKHKVLLKYIFENCNCAGIWEANFRFASFVIGETVTLEDVKEINHKKEQFMFLEDNKIFVKNFIKFQYGNLSYNCKPHLPVIKLLERHNIEFEVIDEDNLSIRQKRKRLTEYARKQIFIRDKFQCQYCGSKEDLEIDHIIPLSKGGDNEEENLITACHTCNKLKGDKDLKTFLKENGRGSKILDRVSNILDTLEEKEKEQYKEKEKDISSSLVLSSSLPEGQKLYGDEYQNVCLDLKQYNKLLGMCASKELLNELINSFSRNIEVGKERPYIADLPNAHYERLKSYYHQRKINPPKQKKEIDGWNL